MNRHFVNGSFQEFLGIWASKGKATLTLDTSDGNAIVSFSAHLGLPGAPLQPPQAGKRHRRPAEVAKGRERAARHQASLAAKAASAPPSSLPAAAPAASTPSSISPATSYAAVVSTSSASPASLTSTTTTSHIADPVVSEVPSTSSRVCKRCNRPCQGHPAPGFGMSRCQVILGNQSLPTTALPPPENPRGPDQLRRMLNTSPILLSSREENCYNCGSAFSPDHRCNNEDKGEENVASAHKKSKPLFSSSNPDDRAMFGQLFNLYSTLK